MTTLKPKSLDSHIKGTPVKGSMRPGSKSWQRKVTASKVAGLLDQSRYITFYEAWSRLAGRMPEIETTKDMLRGTCLEDGVAKLWCEMNEWSAATTGPWSSKEHDWLYATPDRIAHPNDNPDEVYCLEVKTTKTWNGWGEDGSQWVPVDYHWQTLTQHLVTGLPVILTAMGPEFDIRTYYPQWSELEKNYLLSRIPEVLGTLPGGDNYAEPFPNWDDLDLVMANTPVARGTTIEVSPDESVAIEYAEARLDQEVSERAVDMARINIAQRLASADRLVWRGVTLASRTAAGSLRTATPETLRKAL